MQWAARSIPPQRSFPARRCSMSFEPTPSVEAASRRRSSSGYRPAKAPNPCAPVDSTAARSRSTTASAFPSETPAASYVLPRKDRSLETALDKQLGVELRPSLRSLADEADDRVADLDAAVLRRQVEDLAERVGLLHRIVRPQVELREAQDVLGGDELFDPLPRRVELEPVARVRRDERAPARVLLDPQALLLGPGERDRERLVVEDEPDVVDPRQLPLARLDDDVHGAALELGEAELEAEPVELVPGHAGLEGHGVFPDPAVASDEVEPELREVAGLHVADPSCDEVVVEEPHRPAILDSERGRALAPHELVVRPAPARADAPRRRPLRAARADAPPARDAGRALAPVALRARDRPRPARARVADRRLRRAGVPELPHGPARPPRRPRAARDGGRPERADPPSGARAAAGERAPLPRPSARRAPALDGRPLRLAPAVPLPGGAPPRRGPRARAPALLHLRRADVGAGARGAAGAGVVRHRLEARLHRRRPPDRDRARERLHLVGDGLLPLLPARAPAVGDLGAPRPGDCGRGDDARGLGRHDRRARLALPAPRPGGRAPSGAHRARPGSPCGAPRGALRQGAGVLPAARNLTPIVTRALLRRPPRRSRRLLDRAQPALLPRAPRAARLPPRGRGRGRARRDDLVLLRPGNRDRRPAGPVGERALRPVRRRAPPPRARGVLALGRRRAGGVAALARRRDRERARGVPLPARLLRGLLLRPRRA